MQCVCVQPAPCWLSEPQLAADAMTQLAYGFEAGTWRNIFLTGAQELRNGTPASSPMSVRIANSAAQIAGLAPEQAVSPKGGLGLRMTVGGEAIYFD